MGHKHLLAAIKKEIRNNRTNYKKKKKYKKMFILQSLLQFNVMLMAGAEYTGWLTRKKIWTSTRTSSRTVHIVEKL